MTQPTPALKEQSGTVVLLTPGEAKRLAEGHQMQLSTLDGQLVTARLYTFEELIAAHKRITEAAGETPSLTANQARLIVSPRNVRMTFRT